MPTPPPPLASPAPRQSRFPLFAPALAIAALCAIAYLPSLLGRELWTPDEVRWGQVSREVYEGDNPFVMRLLGNYYSDKPPAYFWANAALFSLAGGVNEFTPRILSMISVIAVAWMILALGAQLGARRVGFAAALLWGASLLPGALAATLTLDPFYTVWVVGALAACATAVHRKSWRPATLSAFILAMSIAMFTKGPIGILLPLAALGVASLIGVPLPRRTLWVAIAAIAASLLPIALWLVNAAHVVGWPAIWAQADQHVAERAISSWSHARPPWFFLLTFWGDFFPASLFVPAAIATLAALCRISTPSQQASTPPLAPARRIIEALRRLRTTAKTHPLPFFYAAWFLAIFLLHSLISGKRSPYILPAFPAAALLVAWTMNRQTAPNQASWPDKLLLWARRILAAIWAILALAALAHSLLFKIALALTARIIPPDFPLPALSPWQQAVLWASSPVFLLLALWIAGARLRRSPAPQPLHTLAVGSIFTFCIVGCALFPTLDPYLSGRYIVQAVRPHARIANLSIVCRLRDSAWLVAWKLQPKKHPIVRKDTGDWLRAYKAAPSPALAILRQKDWDTLRQSLEPDTLFLGAGWVAQTRYVVIGKGNDFTPAASPPTTPSP